MATPTPLPATFVDGDVLDAIDLNNLRGAFRVLQVVSTTKTDTFTTTSTSFTDVTGLTASITPSATSSKVLVIASVVASPDISVNWGALRLARAGTAIFIGNAASNRGRGTKIAPIGANDFIEVGMVTLDSPATTSATTYSVQMQVGGGTGYINRTKNDTDSGDIFRAASSITVMEISA